jgi:hypothetical protein
LEIPQLASLLLIAEFGTDMPEAVSVCVTEVTIQGIRGDFE